jgi:hypothetical protein
VLEVERARIEVDLLGVRVYGLPAGVTDLSVLNDARVIATGRCSSTCVVERLQVVTIGKDGMAEHSFARQADVIEYDRAA